MKTISQDAERIEALRKRERALRLASNPAHASWKKQNDLERAESQLRACLAELAELGKEVPEETTK